MFPLDPPNQQLQRLQDALLPILRLTADDPPAAWQRHIDELDRRSQYLNQRRYKALKFRAPGTDLTVGLPKDPQRLMMWWSLALWPI